MDETNQPLSEQFRRAADTWVDAEAAASLLEDLKSAYLAEQMQAHAALPVNRAEQMVKSSRQWRDYVEKTVASRKAANRAKVQLEFIRMRASEWQNEEANKRVEARL